MTRPCRLDGPSQLHVRIQRCSCFRFRKRCNASISDLLGIFPSATPARFYSSRAPQLSSLFPFSTNFYSYLLESFGNASGTFPRRRTYLHSFHAQRERAHLCKFDGVIQARERYQETPERREKERHWRRASETGPRARVDYHSMDDPSDPGAVAKSRGTQQHARTAYPARL